MTEKNLLKLIDLYFEGETSVDQERELREALLDSESSDPRVEEALAVMTFAAEDGRRRAARAVAPRRRKSRAAWPSLAAAAAVPLLLTVGVWTRHSTPAAPCTAVIACVETSDTDIALALMQSQLGDIAVASDNVSASIASDFASLGEAFGSDGL